MNNHLNGELYAVESPARDLDAPARRMLREEHSRPVVLRIEAMLLKHLHSVVPGSLPRRRPTTTTRNFPGVLPALPPDPPCYRRPTASSITWVIERLPTISG